MRSARNIIILAICAAIFILAGLKIIHRRPRYGFPNVVLIIVDALRSDHLGCTGFPDDISPELDKIANKGVIFENAYAQCSWTRPSVGSMITSLYPRSIGLYKEKYDILSNKYMTLAEILKTEGYKTFGITANPNINSVFNFNQGFDEYIDSSVVWQWMNVSKNQSKVTKKVLLPQSSHIFKTMYQKIKKTKKKPFFLQILLMEIHSPFIVRKEYSDIFPVESLNEKNRSYPDEEVINLINGTRNAIRQLSVDISSFIEKTTHLPGGENTLFILTSDHGQGLNDHPHVMDSVGHGMLLYGSQLQVPLIFYHPEKHQEGNGSETMRVRQPIRLLDLMPTILEYVGLSIPDNLHGMSVLPLIKSGGKRNETEMYIFAETNFRKAKKIALYTKEWKLVKNMDSWEGVNPIELHPIEMGEDGILTDQVSDQPEIARNLRLILESWEKGFPMIQSTQGNANPDGSEMDQLKSLGYLD